MLIDIINIVNIASVYNIAIIVQEINGHNRLSLFCCLTVKGNCIRIKSLTIMKEATNDGKRLVERQSSLSNLSKKF